MLQVKQLSLDVIIISLEDTLVLVLQVVLITISLVIMQERDMDQVE